eukprot:12406371-Karenia_brevis.AAC.1
MGYTSRLLWFIRALGPLPAGPLSTYGELFAGMAAWSEAMAMYEYDGRSFDKEYTMKSIIDGHMACDILTPSGFLITIAHIMKMHRGGIFLAAIPCFSWVFFSRFSSGRHVHSEGNDKKWVKFQNVLVSRVVYLLILCMKRGIYWIVEQPKTSIVWEHPRWKYLERRYGAEIDTIEHDMGVYTLDMVKSSVFKGTAPYLRDFGRQLSPLGKQVVLENPNKKKTSEKYLDSEGVQRVKG